MISQSLSLSRRNDLENARQATVEKLCLPRDPICNRWNDKFTTLIYHAPFSIGFHASKPLPERARLIIDTWDNHFPFCINDSPFIIGFHTGKSLTERPRGIIDTRDNHLPFCINESPFIIDLTLANLSLKGYASSNCLPKSITPFSSAKYETPATSTQKMTDSDFFNFGPAQLEIKIKKAIQIPKDLKSLIILDLILVIVV